MRPRPTCRKARANIKVMITRARSTQRGLLTKNVSPIWKAGLAATATALDALDSGSHVVVSDDLYGGTFRLFEKVRRRSADLDFTYVDLTDASRFEREIKPNTRMVWIETPSNPLLKIIDLEEIAKTARKHKIISVSDNTFATPWIQ